jgi:ferritin-like protein
MIYIEKHEEPEWLAEFKQNNPQATYDSKEFKPYISRLNEVLVKEQKHLCAYCCGKIDTNINLITNILSQEIQANMLAKKVWIIEI